MIYTDEDGETWAVWMTHLDCKVRTRIAHSPHGQIEHVTLSYSPDPAVRRHRAARNDLSLSAREFLER